MESLLRRFDKYFSVQYAVLLSVLLMVALYLHTHGFPTADEGWVLEASKRMADGEVVYKNFQFIYHPGILYINALAFKALGASVLTSRIVALVNTFLSLFLLLYLCKKNKFLYVLTALVLTGFLFWGAGHINFSWPVMFCMTLALASAALWTAWFQRKKNKYMIAIGLVTALTIVFKQNFGLAIFVINLFCVFAFTNKSKWKVFRQFLIGLIIIGLAQLIYFWLTASLSWYISDMRYLLIERVFLKGVLNSELPWHYPASPINKIAKVALYNSPLLIALIALFIAWKKKNNSVIYYCLLSISYYVLSIRPTTDYIHLTPLLAFSFFPLAYVLHMFENKWYKSLSILAMLLLVGFGAYSSIFKNYYRWDIPLAKQTQFSSNPNMLVSVDPQSIETINWATSFFNAHSDEKYFFVYSFSPQFTMFSNKKNPTRYDYLHTGVLSPAIEQEVISNLETKQVKFVLTDVNVEKEKDNIAQFIRNHYRPLSMSGKYTIWQKL